MVDLSIPSLSPNLRKVHKPIKLLLLAVILALISLGLMTLMSAHKQEASKKMTSEIIQARQMMLFDTSSKKLSQTDVAEGQSVIEQASSSPDWANRDQLQSYRAMLK